MRFLIGAPFYPFLKHFFSRASPPEVRFNPPVASMAVCEVLDTIDGRFVDVGCYYLTTGHQKPTLNIPTVKWKQPGRKYRTCKDKESRTMFYLHRISLEPVSPSWFYLKIRWIFNCTDAPLVNDGMPFTQCFVRHRLNL